MDPENSPVAVFCHFLPVFLHLLFPLSALGLKSGVPFSAPKLFVPSSDRDLAMHDLSGHFMPADPVDTQVFWGGMTCGDPIKAPHEVEGRKNERGRNVQPVRSILRSEPFRHQFERGPTCRGYKAAKSLVQVIFEFKEITFHAWCKCTYVYFFTNIGGVFVKRLHANEDQETTYGQRITNRLQAI